MEKIMRKSQFIILVLVLSICNGVPHPDSGKRVVEKPLSDQEHYNENDIHNKDYDHEAFLGEQEAKKFEQLSPKESKERLSKIVDKIDKNEDGFVTEGELKDWITYVRLRYILEDADRQWDNYNEDKKENLEWDDYKKFSYSFMDEDVNDEDDDDMKTYKSLMGRDKRRWQTADKNNDNKLSKEEFLYFLHPEEAEHMKEVVILETIEDIDKDGDGKLSLQEYIGDMYSGSEEDEPDWVKNEREQFTTYRDQNKDGFMDKEEVREWVIPSEYDNSEAEARHLIYETDENKDKKLTKEEILNNYDVFVGSQATDFGEALTAKHDEF